MLSRQMMTIRSHTELWRVASTDADHTAGVYCAPARLSGDLQTWSVPLAGKYKWNVRSFVTTKLWILLPLKAFAVGYATYL